MSSLSNDTVIRSAKPDDVNVVVPLIYSSGPVAFDHIFTVEGKGTAQEFLHFTFQRTGTEFSYTNHHCIEKDGRIVAVGAAFDNRNEFKAILIMLYHILRFYGLIKSIGVIRRGLLFEKGVRPPAKGEMAIVHIGVDPNAQGQGYGRAIMQHLIQHGKALSYEKAVLDVAGPNHRARSLYQSLGFKITKRCPNHNVSRPGEEELPEHDRMEYQYTTP